MALLVEGISLTRCARKDTRFETRATLRHGAWLGGQTQGRLPEELCHWADLTMTLLDQMLTSTSQHRSRSSCRVYLSPVLTASLVCHRYAVVKGAMADFVSLNEKIKCGMAFRKHVELAIGLDPSDSLAYHLLGRWCFEVRFVTSA